MCHITLNTIAIFGDNGAITPGGVRIGTPAMTSRGCLESNFETVAFSSELHIPLLPTFVNSNANLAEGLSLLKGGRKVVSL
ncbi:hypothetical protein CRYUN_Cryun04dG0048300 [Craigia yunnanensis]